MMTTDKLAMPLYRDRRTANFAAGNHVRAFTGFEEQAKKRLAILEDAESLSDLMKLPSNRLEALSGNRQGQYSIRINQKWRICFEWPGNHAKPYNIEIIDYH